MCKTPASEVQAVDQDQEIMEEDEEPEPLGREDSELSTEPSLIHTSDEEWSESDAESASGNRVTPSMLIFYFMKEKGLISEETYREMQPSPVCCDLNKVSPRILTGFETDSDDETYSFGMDDDNDSEYDEDSKIYESAVTNGTESEAGTNISLEKTEEQNNELESLINGDEGNACEEMLNAIKQVTESEESEKESTDKGAQGDGLINNTMNAQKVENFEVTDNKAVHDKVENKPDTPVPSMATDDLISEEKVETNNTKPVLDIESGVTAGRTVTEDFDTACETNGFEGKRIESIENILKEMANEKRIQEEEIMLLDTYSAYLDEFYSCNRDTKKFGEPNEKLRQFALFLNYYSPSAYNYIRDTFVTPLPGYEVLCSWYMRDDGSPGLTRRAFDILKRKASGRRLYCTLMSDAVFLTNHGLNYDQVDFGGGCNYEYTDKAVMVFALVLVGLDDDWKIPIGYFRARHVPAETHAFLVKMCLSQCHKAGADVVAVTLDTPAPAEHLGCDFRDVRNLKTTFKHPECDRDVAVWIDPCLAIRSVHLTLKGKGCLYIDDTKVRYNVIRRARRLHSDDGLRYERFSASWLELRRHVAKLNLTSAMFSDSLRRVISLNEEFFPSRSNTSGTTDFIGAVSNLHGILNSKLSLDSGYRRAMDANSKDLLDALEAAKGYFADIFSDPRNGLSRFDKDNYSQQNVYRSFIDGKPVCGFVDYLICIASLEHLFATLVATGAVPRLATHRLCKDHVGDFIRHMQRNENVQPEDFNAYHYESYLSELLGELEGKTRLSDRNVSLEYYPIENKCSPASEINETSGNRAYDDYSYRPKTLQKTAHVARTTKIVRGISVALDTERDISSRKCMVAYLAGWIATKFARCLKCEECIDCLLSDEKLWFHKFITLNDLKGICLPSEELFRVCWECETVLRRGSPRPQCEVPGRLLPRFPWASRRGAHHPLHHVHLVRAIVSKYIPLRVPVPLSNKETIRMSQMFGFIKCLHVAGFFIQG